ncbi:hypothetical protein BDR03DRAFT_939607 [Suillus americanus]|nr:hypothetical protein BDR03DRAFT_939607 [Suillus americanus]
MMDMKRGVKKTLITLTPNFQLDNPYETEEKIQSMKLESTVISHSLIHELKIEGRGPPLCEMTKS